MNKFAHWCYFVGAVFGGFVVGYGLLSGNQWTILLGLVTIPIYAANLHLSLNDTRHRRPHELAR